MLVAGDIIDDKYRIVRQLGQGGMGAVYEGENTRIHRRVAIKVLHTAVSNRSDVVQRFEREAQAAGRIGSDHIVEVLDLGNLATGERFMVMEYLDGESLGDRIKRRKRLSAHEVAPIVYQMLEGLAAAHQAGIIHRDLKPDNVFLLASRSGQRDFVKLLDFGVSKFSALDNDSLSMTKTGAVMGTPYYMSPEQARGAKIDHRSDLYSCGVVLYQAVTGRVPFAAETFNELVFKIALESPEPAELVIPTLDPAFASIIAKAMIRDVNVRFQSCREFQAAIAQWMSSGAAVSATSTPGMVSSVPSHPPVGYGSFTPQGGVPSADRSGPHAMLGTSPVPGALISSPSLSGPHNALTSSQVAALGTSQTGMAMPAPPPRSSGALIAIGLLGTLVVAAGAFGVYKIVSDGPFAPPVAAAPQHSPGPKPVASAPISPPLESSAPEPAGADASAAAATAAAPVMSVASALPSPGRVSVVRGPSPGGRKPAGSPAPSGTPTKQPHVDKPAGRVIGSDL